MAKRASDSELAEFGDRLRALREDLNLTQAEVAARLGITDGGYGHFERGRRLPSAAELPWLARGLGVSTGELIVRLGLIDQKILDAPLPEALAGRLQRIVADYDLLDSDGKSHVADILGLASSFGPHESTPLPTAADQRDTENNPVYVYTGRRGADRFCRTARVLALA